MTKKQPAFTKNDIYFDSEAHKMYMAVDCVIFGFDGESLNLLLMKRLLEPFAGEWSLIGSFVHLDESITQAAKRILKERTGLDEIFLEQSKVYGSAQRDPGYRCVSVALYALIRSDKFHRVAGLEEFGTQWFNLNELPPLVLDHEIMVADALDTLSIKAKYQPFGFELLPVKFTLPQLQKLYEALFQKKLDSRNFRKKILSLNILKQLDEKDKSGSKKGAWLYKFDFLKYKKLVDSGYSLEI